MCDNKNLNTHEAAKVGRKCKCEKIKNLNAKYRAALEEIAKEELIKVEGRGYVVVHAPTIAKRVLEGA